MAADRNEEGETSNASFVLNTMEVRVLIYVCFISYSRPRVVRHCCSFDYAVCGKMLSMYITAVSAANQHTRIRRNTSISFLSCPLLLFPFFIIYLLIDALSHTHDHRMPRDYNDAGLPVSIQVPRKVLNNYTSCFREEHCNLQELLYKCIYATISTGPFKPLS